MRAITSAFWAEVPGGMLLASMTWVWEVTAYPVGLFPSLIKLPSVNHSFLAFGGGSLPRSEIDGVTGIDRVHCFYMIILQGPHFCG